MNETRAVFIQGTNSGNSQPLISVWESPPPPPLPLPAGGRLLPHAEATRPGLPCSACARAMGAAPGTAPEGCQSCPQPTTQSLGAENCVWVADSPHLKSRGTKPKWKGSSEPGCSDARVTGGNYLAPVANYLYLYIKYIKEGPSCET